jgi:chromosomal replication initiation ATPase DnaA
MMARRTEIRQLHLDLAAPEPSYARDDFLLAPCNRWALNAVLDWRSWGSDRLVLSGPPASGKTHLAHVWATETDASLVPAADLLKLDFSKLTSASLAVENADHVAGSPEAERSLLHLYNALQQSGNALLLTSRAEPGRWGVTLPDLSSRIVAARHARLDPPDDTLLAAVLVKLFDDRQVRVSPRIIEWLVRRMDRSLSAASDIVTQLDEAALATGGPITRAMAAAVLDNHREAPS